VFAAWALRHPRGAGAVVGVFFVAVLTYGIADDLAAARPPARAHHPHARAHAGHAPAGRTPRTRAQAGIPPAYLAAYRSGARQCPGLSWTVLAGIGQVESNHGRARLPGVRSGWNAAGAAGPMQFGIGVGAAGNAWARYGRGGNVYDVDDAAPAAARYLCAQGAPRDLRGAVFAYNHSHAYVNLVLAIAARYRRGDG
jgi:hypothetical protein